MEQLAKKKFVAICNIVFGMNGKFFHGLFFAAVDEL
jgi:hypothetical protein